MTTFTNTNTALDFPRHQQYLDHQYNFFVSNTCMAGLYEMQKNYASILNLPIGLLDTGLTGNTTYAFTRRRTLMGISDDYTDAAVGYMTGGRVSNLAVRTLNGYIGLYNEYPALLELPNEISYIEEKATKDGKSLQALSIDILTEVLKNGNCHILADVDSDGKLRFVIYNNESRINWQQEGSDETDYRYTQIVFKESEISGDLIDQTETNTTYIKYYLNDDGIYSYARYNESKEIIEGPFSPSYKGRNLDYIPIFSAGAIDNSPDIDPAPLEPIMQIMIAILGMDTELSYINLLTTAPTLVISGANEEDLPSVMGAGVTLLLPQYTSTAQYTSIDGSNLEHLREKLNDAYAEAQEYGASLLGSSKNMSESGEALRIRQQATTVTLRSIVTNVGKAILKSLRYIAEWSKSNIEEVSYEPNKDFSTFTLPADEQQSLVQSWQGGAISHTTLLNNFKKANMLLPGETVEDEIKRTQDPKEQFKDEGGSGTVNKPFPGDKATKSNGD